MCVFICYWAGLWDAVTRSNVVDGADRLQQAAAVRMHEMARRADTLIFRGVESDDDIDVD
jgi:hypothetical protein